MNARAVIVAVAGALTACGSPPEPSSATPASSAPIRCDELDLAAEPELFGWDPGSRAKLATLAGTGMVVVKYERNGCDVVLEVLPQCTSRKAYYTFAREPGGDQRSARDERERYLKFPIAAARLRARLTSQTAVRVDFQQSGVERIPAGMRIDTQDLEGHCEGATHVVSGIYRGAFTMAAGSTEALSVSTSLLAVDESQETEVIDRAGDAKTCKVTHNDLVPGCDVPLRVSLLRLGADPTTGATASEGCPEGMAAIDAGQFTMGVGNDSTDRGPEHEVALGAYCLGRSEITAAEYQKCVSAKACTPAGQGSLCSAPDSAELPRNCVSRDQAGSYCEWAGGRLPTEAEWEYAARMGGQQWTYPIGNDWMYGGQSCFGRRDRKPCTVRSYSPEAWGLHDLTGNVREWVLDQWVSYRRHARTNPRGVSDSPFGVARGGCYADSHHSAVESTLRHQTRPETSDPTLGFRCAR